MAYTPRRCPLACQLAPEYVRSLQPTFFRLGIHPDLLLSDSSHIAPDTVEHWVTVGKELAELGLEASVHLPFDGINLGSRSPRVRDLGEQILVDAIRVASSTGAKLAVMHTGFVPLIPEKAAGNWLGVFSERFAMLREHAESEGVSILLENTWEPDTWLFEELRTRLGPDLSFCLDIGHMFSFSKVPASEWIALLGPHTRIVHLHDNDLKEDQHLPLGSGAIDLSFLPELVGMPAAPPRLVLEFRPRFMEAAREYLSSRFPGIV